MQTQAALWYIPACAGETLPVGDGKSPHEVHPRVCGGNLSTSEVQVVYAGTSPRVRGKQEVRRTDLAILRYIPACAGETIIALHG